MGRIVTGRRLGGLADLGVPEDLGGGIREEGEVRTLRGLARVFARGVVTVLVGNRGDADLKRGAGPLTGSRRGDIGERIARADLNDPLVLARSFGALGPLGVALLDDIPH